MLTVLRLNLQHYLWKDVLGYNIHPDIPVKDNKDFAIADIGTGTGHISLQPVQGLQLTVHV